LNKSNYQRSCEDFVHIPTAPIAYWISNNILDVFRSEKSLGEFIDPRQGMATTDNDRFLRVWAEIDFNSISMNGSGELSKWFLYNKGGEYRRWYGTGIHVVDYAKNGAELIELVRQKYPRISDPEFVIKNRAYYFREGITWTDISLLVSARWLPSGYIFDAAGPVAFSNDKTTQLFTLSFLNSILCTTMRPVLNPSLHFTLGDLANLPYPSKAYRSWTPDVPEECIRIAKADWDSSEISWDFHSLPIIRHKAITLQRSQEATDVEQKERFRRMKELEEGNNRLFIEAYGLQAELSPEVPDDQIALYRPDRAEDIKRLLSYVIGCAMGR
jgi:hypothetical protein